MTISGDAHVSFNNLKIVTSRGRGRPPKHDGQLRLIVFNGRFVNAFPSSLLRVCSSVFDVSNAGKYSSQKIAREVVDLVGVTSSQK